MCLCIQINRSIYTYIYVYIYVLRDTQIVFCSFAQGCVVADVGKAEAHFEKALNTEGLDAEEIKQVRAPGSR